jgi:hypothetical protein
MAAAMVATLSVRSLQWTLDLFLGAARSSGVDYGDTNPTWGFQQQ